jgi:hypothetical protein
MSELLLLDGSSTSAPPGSIARKGLVRAQNKVVLDDDGIFHPLGLTFFWALYGWKHERERVLAHLKWFQTKGFDYLRILGECDWTGRAWGPAEFPDYDEVLQGFVDAAYDHGLRSEITIVGGRQYDKDTGQRRFVPETLARRVAQALSERTHKVMHYECANEWMRLDKVSMDDLVDMGGVLSQWPNLTSLSCPAGEREHAQYQQHTKDDDYYVEVTEEMLAEDKAEPYSGYSDMIEATKVAGCEAYTIHPRRSSHDHGWSHVRQGYDFKDFPGATWNNEPEGPQSSVVSMTDPLQLVCTRLVGIMCGGAGYVLHVGQGVTGLPDPNHNRPNNMWEVNNIDLIMKVMREADDLMPLGVENWQCVNNGRSNHPLKLDPVRGFWESGAHDRAPAVNKNYAAISSNAFVVMLTGVKSNGFTGPVPAGTAHRNCHVEAIDPLTHEVVVQADLAAGQSWTVPGRGDTMAAYVIRGRYL